MIRRPLLGPTLAILLAPIGLQSEARQAPAERPGRSYKVAFWYDLDRPFSSVRYRAYDLAKGEYDEAAVDRWRKTIRENHPQAGTDVRELTTVGEPRATEAERLASAVEREKRRRVDLNRRPATRAFPKPVKPSPSSPTRDPDVGRASFGLPSPGSPGPIANPPASPFPYPYRARPL